MSKLPHEACNRTIAALRAALAAAEAFGREVQEDRDRLAAALTRAGEREEAAEACNAAFCEQIRAEQGMRVAAEAKLADERRQLTAALETERLHADALAGALEDAGCFCQTRVLSGMRPARKCMRCVALEVHAARRAHDSECESEFDSQVHAQTPCGCAARRAAEVEVDRVLKEDQ